MKRAVLYTALAMFTILIISCAYLYVRYSTPIQDCTVLRRIPTENGVVEIVDDTCQEGLPHTTDSETIRMTETTWESSRQAEILTHERIHLDQKRWPAKWSEFYKHVWDYDISNIPPPDLPRSIVAELRPNPDTRHAPWATWMGRYVFFPVYGNDERPLQSATVRIWDTIKRAFVEIPADWKAEFCDSQGCPHQYEHPHELAAELLTLSSQSPAAKQLRKNISLLNSRYGGNGSRSDRIQSD